MAYALPTRSGSEDPVFGSYLELLPSNKLPSKTEIYRNFLYRRESEIPTIYQRSGNHGKLVKSLDSDTKNKIVNDLIESLTQIWWTKASIPVREHRHIFDEVKKLLKEAAEFSKDMLTFKKVGREEFLKSKGFDKILDISKCRCFTRAKSIQEVQWSLCKCVPKFPKNEISFYAAQKFSRRGTIGGIDLKGTKLKLLTDVVFVHV